MRATSHLFLVMMLFIQLVLPAMIAADSSTNNDAIEPNVVDVQSQEENTDGDIESPISSQAIVEDEEKKTAATEQTETSHTEEAADEEAPVEEDIEKPIEEQQQSENKSPPIEEEQTAPTPEPEEKPEAPQGELKEPEAEKPVENPKEEALPEEVEPEESPAEIEEAKPDPMLDGFPATTHPANATPLTYFAAGSLGSALAIPKAGRMMAIQATDLEPGEVQTSKTATPVPGMVNTWDVTVRVEGRDNNVVQTTDIVLVLDRSGSMEGTRLTNLKIAGENFIDQTIPLDPNLRIAIVSYSSDYSDGSQSSPLYRIDHAFSKDTDSLKTALNALVAFGGTHTQAGVTQGRQLLNGSSSDNKYMILLSDGEPTFSYEPVNWTIGRPSWGTTGGLTANNQRTGVYDGQFTATVRGTGSALRQSYTLNNRRYHIDNGLAAIRAGQDARVGITKLYTIGIQLDTETAGILEQIASPGAAYQANRPEDLPGLYDDVRTEIMTQSALQNVTIQDEMGDGFSLVSNTVNQTEGTTAVTNATGTANDTITWTISPHVSTLVPGTTDVRYAEMTYRIEVNPTILDAAVATPGTTTDHDLYLTNKETVLNYRDIHDVPQVQDLQSPEVDPVLLRIKKTLIDADANESRRFNVRISNSTAGYDELVELIPNGDDYWLTTLRQEGNYQVEEVSVSGNPSTPLSQFITSYTIDGATGTTFSVHHDGAIPRGDISVEVTNREIKSIDITGTKVWEGGPATKPDVTLQLYRNSIAHREPITLTHPTTTYTWTNLDDIDSAGGAYIYTVREVNPPEGYLSSSSGLTVTNVYQIPDDGVATATKIWQGSTPTDFYAIPLTLWRTLDGVTFEIVPNVSPILTQDPIVNPNEHTYHYRWENLVETDFNGRPYTFYFTEDQVLDRYERDYLDTTLDGMVDSIQTTFALSGGRVLNREMNIDFQFNKVDEVGEALTGAVFELHRHDGQDRILKQRLGDILAVSSFHFTDLSIGTYTLTEVSVPEGYALPADNTWTFEVVWDDVEKQLRIVFETGDDIDGEIENYPVGMLPETGGPGANAYLITGIVSLLSLGTIFIWRQQRDGVHQND